MTEQDDAEVRAVLRENGVDVPSRGRISAANLARYQEITGSGFGDGGGLPPDPDYDGGVTDADFPPDEIEDTPAAVEPERKPRRVRQTRPAGGLAARLRGGKTKPAAKGRKPKHPRVPVDRLIEHLWGLLARISEPIAPATSKCLQLEADVAGVVLEDIVRGTVVDRALQPVARAEEKGKKAAALAGPPLIVLGLEMAQGLPPEQRAARQMILLPMLREALALQVEIVGERAAEIAERASSRAETDAEVQKRMELILAPLMAGQPEPEPEMAGAAA